ncbi:MAG: DUF362 domain-containing protein, partial [Coriobacteriia bacterium]|nr:DUF362 domain-containing protein [Coriobacteriia bacterium]
MKATVSIVRCEDYTPSNVLRAVEEAVDILGGIGQFVQTGQRVLVKPNLLSPHPPEDAVTTHPAVVEAVIGLAAAAGATCVIGDCPSIRADTPAGYQQLLNVTGMSDVMQRTGATSLRFDDSAMEWEVESAKVFRKLTLAEALDIGDVLFNVAKFKTHELTL